MPTVNVSRKINAPIDLVFQTIADIQNFSNAIPHIVRVELLSEISSGVGTRFRETRLMNNKEVSVDLEVTEYALNESIRIISDTNGTVWDTLFTVSHAEDATLLCMTMEAKAYRLFSKLINLLIIGMISKAVERDMDLVKEYCER